jgi:putative ABC transport system permease protein
VKATVRDQVATSLRADVIVQDFFSGITPAATEAVEGTDGVALVATARQGEMQVDGDTKSVAATEGGNLGRAIELGVQEGALDDLVGDTVFVHTDPATDLGLTVGSTVQARFPTGMERTLTVVGIFDDASVLGVNWLISTETFMAGNPQVRTDSFLAAIADDGVTPDALKASVESSLEPVAPQLDVQTLSDAQAGAEQALNIVLGIAVGFLMFAVLIATLGIINTLALSITERTRELGLLRAVGMTRRQTKRMVKGESVIVAVFGAVVGIVLGVALGLAVATALPSSIIETIAVPWVLLVAMFLGAIVIGVLAGVYPAHRAAKLDVLQAIASE